MKTVTLRSKYALTDDANRDVLLSVSFADGQFGSSIVDRNGTILRIGQVVGLPLGKRADLLGGTVRITSTVTDINPNTNRLEVTYDLKGGQMPLEVSEHDTAESEGVSERFEHIVTFV